MTSVKLAPCILVLSKGALMWHMYLLWQEAPPDTDVVVEWRRQLSSRVECRVGASSLILILIASNISLEKLALKILYG